MPLVDRFSWEKMRLFSSDCFCFLSETRSEIISFGREEKRSNSCLRELEISLIKEMQRISEVPLESLVVMHCLWPVNCSGASGKQRSRVELNWRRDFTSQVSTKVK